MQVPPNLSSGRAGASGPLTPWSGSLWHRHCPWGQLDSWTWLTQLVTGISETARYLRLPSYGSKSAESTFALTVLVSEHTLILPLTQLTADGHVLSKCKTMGRTWALSCLRISFWEPTALTSQGVSKSKVCQAWRQKIKAAISAWFTYMYHKVSTYKTRFLAFWGMG